MDLKMPHMNGIQATEAIRRLYPDLPVVVLTTYDEDEWIVDAIRAGAAGYLLKDSSTEDIIAAVEGVVAGETPIAKAVTAKLFQYVQFGVPSRSQLEERLSERELAILRLLASGLSNADIASRLNLAEGTVRNHLTNIFATLEVTDRAQATAVAWRYGLVAQGD
ncbi:MAG: response regulator transcription factor, partial [Anaerolineae bacterium]|nr:response regulator transcription factor [Anaerolineae bacterium]